MIKQEFKKQKKIRYDIGSLSRDSDHDHTIKIFANYNFDFVFFASFGKIKSIM